MQEQAIRSGEPDQYLRLTAARAERITVRRRLLAAAVLGGAGALVALWTFAPPWLLAVLAGRGPAGVARSADPGAGADRARRSGRTG